jgi:TonB family protein
MRAHMAILSAALLTGCASQPSGGGPVKVTNPTTIHEAGKERIVPPGDPSLAQVPGSRPAKMLSPILAHALCLDCGGPSSRPGDGRTILKTWVTEAGQVWSTKVVRSGGEATDRTATTMIGRWRFRPFVEEGQPTPFCSVFDIRFAGGTMEVVPPLNVQ